mmetsp:Transcript_38079/g.89172  ORF Transcript_38079/g.89172 Transcript_38079/m.89172 type:complete len:364 (-) Transcript_38079:149-1240(-)
MRPNFDSLQQLRDRLAAAGVEELKADVISSVEEYTTTTARPVLVPNRCGSCALVLDHSSVLPHSFSHWLIKHPCTCLGVPIMFLACLCCTLLLLLLRCSCRRRAPQGRVVFKQDDWPLPPACAPALVQDDGQQLLRLDLPKQWHANGKITARLSAVSVAEPSSKGWFALRQLAEERHPEERRADEHDVAVHMSWRENADTRPLRQIAIGLTSSTSPAFTALLTVTSSLVLEAAGGEEIGHVQVLARGKSVLRIDGNAVLALSANQEASAIEVAALPSGRLLATAAARQKSSTPSREEQSRQESIPACAAEGASPVLEEPLAEKCVDILLRPSADPMLMMACILAVIIFAPPRKFENLVTFADE